MICLHKEFVQCTSSITMWWSTLIVAALVRAVLTVLQCWAVYRFVHSKPPGRKMVMAFNIGQSFNLFLPCSCFYKINHKMLRWRQISMYLETFLVSLVSSRVVQRPFCALAMDLFRSMLYLVLRKSSRSISTWLLGSSMYLDSCSLL